MHGWPGARLSTVIGDYVNPVPRQLAIVRYREAGQRRCTHTHTYLALFLNYSLGVIVREGVPAILLAPRPLDARRSG